MCSKACEPVCGCTSQPCPGDGAHPWTQRRWRQRRKCADFETTPASTLRSQAMWPTMATTCWSATRCWNGRPRAVSLHIDVAADFCGPSIDAVKTLIDRRIGEDNHENVVTIGSLAGHESDVTKACEWCGTLGAIQPDRRRCEPGNVPLRSNTRPSLRIKRSATQTHSHRC